MTLVTTIQRTQAASTPDELEAEGHELVARGHARLAEAVKARASESKTKDYSTGPGGPLPPGRSRRWLREHAPLMGGVRTGGKRGRDVVWTVARESYDAWMGKPGAVRSAKLATVVSIDALIAESGYRATRGAR